MMYWKVHFAESGEVASVERLADGEDAEQCVIVRADSRESAEIKAVRIYHARKALKRRAEYREKGLCQCGNRRDRPSPQGGMFLQCRTCHARELARKDRKRGVDPAIARERAFKAVRVTPPELREQERAAIDAVALRKEILSEVRKVWVNSPNVGAFTAWLSRELGRP